MKSSPFLQPPRYVSPPNLLQRIRSAWRRLIGREVLLKGMVGVDRAGGQDRTVWARYSFDKKTKAVTLVDFGTPPATLMRPRHFHPEFSNLRHEEWPDSLFQSSTQK